MWAASETDLRLLADDLERFIDTTVNPEDLRRRSQAVHDKMVAIARLIDLRSDQLETEEMIFRAVKFACDVTIIALGEEIPGLGMIYFGLTAGIEEGFRSQDPAQVMMQAGLGAIEGYLHEKFHHINYRAFTEILQRELSFAVLDVVKKVVRKIGDLKVKGRGTLREEIAGILADSAGEAGLVAMFRVAADPIAGIHTDEKVLQVLREAARHFLHTASEHQIDRLLEHIPEAEGGEHH